MVIVIFRANHFFAKLQPLKNYVFERIEEKAHSPIELKLGYE